MPRILSRLALPLLTKELIEQSARKRTYVIRVLYAVMLFFIAFLNFYDKIQTGAANPLAVLGSGRELFLVLVATGFGGIYLFMPAITCSVISQEKERASLQLLFLTRLGPWTIVFEKLLGRVVPMLGCLLLSLPLMGFAYTLGGVSRTLIWTGVWLLALAVVQMGALAVACSAYFRTTVGAFVASYIIALIMLFGPYFFGTVVILVGSALGFNTEDFLTGGPRSPTFPIAFFCLMPFFGMFWFVVSTETPGSLGLWSLLAHSLAVLTFSGACLGLARYWLTSRAMSAARSRVLDLLRNFDRRIFRRQTGQPVGADEHETSAAHLPLDEPIAWREATKRALGRPQFLLLSLVVIEVPLLLLFGLLTVASQTSGRPNGTGSELLGGLWALSWALAILVVLVRAASLIAGERSHQTLEVICVTPLSGRDIVLQKMRSVRWLILLLAVPLLTLFAFQAHWASTVDQRRGHPWWQDFDPLQYVMCATLAVAVYLPLVAWSSFLIGLTVRTQARAILVSLVAAVVTCLAPWLFLVLPLEIAWSGNADVQKTLNWVSLVSPASIVFKNESNLARYFDARWGAIGLNFAVYGCVLLGVRQVCLARADRWLGRAAQSDRRPAAEHPQGQESASAGETLGEVPEGITA